LPLLAKPVTIHDIQDAERFVRATIADGLVLTSDQRDELICEGLRILWTLSDRYQPGYGGRNPATSRFSGYAAKYLPGKLSDAWHRLQGHTLVVLPTGKRQWHYNPRPVSLEAIVEATPNDSIASLTVNPNDHMDSELARKLGTALDQQWAVTRLITVKVGVLFGLGHSPASVARILEINGPQIMMATELIKSSAHRMDAVDIAA
jgi:hypothetical protein